MAVVVVMVVVRVCVCSTLSALISITFLCSYFIPPFFQSQLFSHRQTTNCYIWVPNYNAHIVGAILAYLGPNISGRIFFWRLISVSDSGVTQTTTEVDDSLTSLNTHSKSVVLDQKLSLS